MRFSAQQQQPDWALSKLAWANPVQERYSRYTQRGFLSGVYAKMLHRVNGHHKEKAHLYHGLSILPQRVFLMWAVGDGNFQTLWAVWQKSGLPLRLTPTVDRIIPALGYTLENMRWLSQADNSGRAVHDHRGEKHPSAKLTKEQVLAIRADSVSTNKELAAHYDVISSHIWRIRAKKAWQHI